MSRKAKPKEISEFTMQELEEEVRRRKTDWEDAQIEVRCRDMYLKLSETLIAAGGSLSPLASFRSHGLIWPVMMACARNDLALTIRPFKNLWEG